jgi:hypothetical protein
MAKKEVFEISNMPAEMVTRGFRLVKDELSKEIRVVDSEDWVVLGLCFEDNKIHCIRYRNIQDDAYALNSEGQIEETSEWR